MHPIAHITGESAAYGGTNPSAGKARLFGDLISYHKNGKGLTAIVGKVQERE